MVTVEIVIKIDMESAMVNVTSVRQKDPLWQALMEYARDCTWRAGPLLAQQMEKNLFQDFERVFAATYEGEIAGYCTFQKTDCIPNVPYTPYISFVFVGEAYRGQRISQLMICHVLAYAKTAGFDKVYLVSGEQGLYEKYGFVKLEEKMDHWGRVEQIFCIDT